MMIFVHMFFLFYFSIFKYKQKKRKFSSRFFQCSFDRSIDIPREYLMQQVFLSTSLITPVNSMEKRMLISFHPQSNIFNLKKKEER